MIIYLIIINLIAFFMMVYDKRQAKNQKWRVPEKRLFMIALIGGAVGLFAGMRLVRHKTKHWTFVIGIPFLILLNMILLYPMIYYNPMEWLSILVQFKK
ncbi:Uncharacterized membrane protein YsdA, DUF1294 family [Seinonella peptonophila]|uniref:Uncharacterized membrane protein YsdA, DUF1294 family n=2 Tax=Seinonella peptonophila TaxID=112248 RepID=A0A1M4X4S2_9BACL|nr:Uncharacterized membrane protein YsdA, DUF1294 family [Seinonella peptonophila]